MVLRTQPAEYDTIYYIGHGRHKGKVWLQAADPGPGAFCKAYWGVKKKKNIGKSFSIIITYCFRHLNVP